MVECEAESGGMKCCLAGDWTRGRGPNVSLDVVKAKCRLVNYESGSLLCNNDTTTSLANNQLQDHVLFRRGVL